jgi:two-component system, cell cycle sensor histidine kinase and response regulator CckA
MPVDHSLIVEQILDNSADVITSVVADEAEREYAEQVWRDSEERYREIVENAHDIIYSHNLEGNYTSVNKAGERITGYTREEVLKLNLAQTIVPEHLEKAYEMLQRKLAGKTNTVYEVEILAKDGRRIAVEVNTTLIYHNDVPIGVQGIARDVTERKLFDEQLRQSQKMEAIGQFAGGVAHDFNNLLTTINGYSSFALQRAGVDARIRGYLVEIKKAGDRATSLTRQLSALARKDREVLDRNRR